LPGICPRIRRLIQEQLILHLPTSETMLKRYSKSTLAQNTLWMVLGQGLRLGISVLYFTVIARSLGTHNYGAFVAVVSLVAIVFPFGALGSGILLIKNVSRDQSLFGVYWGRGLLTTTVASSALLLVTVALARFILPTEIPFPLLLLVSASDLIGMSLIWLAGQAFQAFERLNWTAIIHVLISATRLIGALIVVQIHPHPTALQWGYIYSCSTATVVIASLALVTAKLGLPHLAWPRSKAELREGFFFSASLCAQTVYNDLDKTMLASLSTLEATGIYGAAYRILEASVVPIASLRQAAYPNFFRRGLHGISGCLPYAKLQAARALLCGVVIAAGLLVLAGVVPYFLGQEYARAVEALRWLAILPIFRAVHYFYSDALSGAGHQGLRTALQAAVALFNVLINCWLIPAYSWRGAAWSSIASDGLLAVAVVVAAGMLSRQQGTSTTLAESELAESVAS
jgi:O-antigen/teichoic acid export membrane protein